MKYSWKIDNFDSEVFGFKVAKVETIDSEDSPEIIDKIVGDLIMDLNKERVGYATYRVKFNDFPIIQALQRSGFVLVDGLISLGINISEVSIAESVGEIREATRSDLDKLKQMTSGLYLKSRVSNDPLISKERADKFYTKWIENSLLGEAADSVLVWEESDKILGYLTLQKKGQIPLVGVAPQARGKGIAKKLIKASLRKFGEWKVEDITIETQMGNIAALRAYQDCGFKVVNSFLTLRWAKDD